MLSPNRVSQVMKFGLPRRLLRVTVYALAVLSLATVLLLIANKQEVINIDQYLPAYLTPTFFQPDADIYIIDISINECYKFNKNPNCGVPNAGHGKLGNLESSGGWIRVDKDLTLNSRYLVKNYFSYKYIKPEAIRNGELDEASKQVITDMAVYNHKLDGQVTGNKAKIPLKIIQEFRSNDIFDDEDHDYYRQKNIQGEVYKEDSHKFKASDGNKKIEEGMKQEEKQKEEKKQKEPEQKQPEQEQPKENTKSQDGQKNKRRVETELSALKIDYEIPTKEQLAEHGWSYKSNGIWVKYGLYSTRKGLTGIDLLFGNDAVDPRPNWNLIQDRPLSDVDASKGREPLLTFRRGPKLDYKSSEYQVPLKIQADGKFKILQVADLHFSTGYGKCRDPEPGSTKEGCLADPRTLKFLEKVLDIEKPNMVVLTGDQIFGDESPDAETAVFKALNPFIKRKIPFAATLGNHDDEGSMSRSEVMTLMTDLPYSLAANGPEEVAGIGNYLVNIEAHSTKNSAILLYFLDTHKYSPNPKVNPGYDWIKESQLKFVEREYGMFKKAIEAFSKIHLSMAFFHIPLPEYRNLNQPYIGEKREGITAPRYNTNAREVLGHLGVKISSVGHDHCNDYCLQDGHTEGMTPEEGDKMWLCYGGGSGEGGYGGYGGYVRRLRTYDLDTTKGEIKTWKRLESDPEQKFDEQILVTGGKVVNM